MNKQQVARLERNVEITVMPLRVAQRYVIMDGGGQCVYW